jgi:hypothetical protein
MGVLHIFFGSRQTNLPDCQTRKLARPRLPNIPQILPETRQLFPPT